MGNLFKKKGPIHIGIVEDDKVYRRTLELSLGKEKDFKLVFLIGSLEEMLLQNGLLKEVDIMLLDMKLGEGMSIDSLPAVRNLCPNAKVIMVTAFYDLGIVNNSIRNKVEGYYLKGSSLELPEMIRTVHKGFTVYDPLVNEKFSAQLDMSDSAFSHYNLTNKEAQIVKLLTNGFSYKAISDKQQISLNTVRQHVRNIYRKVEVSSRYELIQRIQKFV
jgi:DNA-binding NarL/FixJ family response regulator